MHVGFGVLWCVCCEADSGHEGAAEQIAYKKELYKKAGSIGIRRKGGSQIFSLKKKEWAYEKLVDLADKVIRCMESGEMTEDQAKTWAHGQLKAGDVGIVFDFIY
jgi:hypothetical protein